jgi:hypothetical protein
MSALEARLLPNVVLVLVVYFLGARADETFLLQKPMLATTHLSVLLFFYVLFVGFVGARADETCLLQKQMLTKPHLSVLLFFHVLFVLFVGFLGPQCLVRQPRQVAPFEDFYCAKGPLTAAIRPSSRLVDFSAAAVP